MATVTPAVETRRVVAWGEVAILSMAADTTTTVTGKEVMVAVMMSAMVEEEEEIPIGTAAEEGEPRSIRPKNSR